MTAPPDSHRAEGGSPGGTMSLSRWFLYNPVAANLLMLFLLAGGLLVSGSIHTRVFPDIEPDVIEIRLPFPGASPSEIEESMASRVEQAVLGIDGVRFVTSRASENIGLVLIEITEDADLRKVKEDAKSAIDELSGFPPQGAERPVIAAREFSSDVVTLAVVGDAGQKALRRAADDVESALLALPEVTMTAIEGARRYEISIEISQDNLRRYELSLSDIADAVRGASIDLSGGTIRAQSGQIVLRTAQKRFTGDEFASVIVKALPDGSVIRLGQIAMIGDAFSPDQVVTTFNGRPAVLVQIDRAKSQSVLEIKRAVDAFRADYEMPEGLELIESRDQTIVLRERLNLLARNCLFSFALVFVFLVLMLDLKLAVWVSVGIATAFTGGLMLFGFIGGSITLISSFAFVMVLGLVVDDAIVIGESIDDAHARWSDDKGDDRAIALAGLRSVMAPVTVGLTTTVVAFSPLLVATGLVTQLARAIPQVVICVLIISVIEAFLILPAHVKSRRKWSRGPLAMIRKPIDGALRAFSQTILARLVGVAVRWRYLTLASAIGFVIVMIGVVRGGLVPFIFFPQLERNEIAGSVTLPDGAAFSRTREAVARMENGLLAVADDLRETTGQRLLVSILANAGGLRDTMENQGIIRAELTPYGDRYITSNEIGRLWQDKVGPIEGVEQLSFNSLQTFFGADVSFELVHDDHDALEKAAAAFRGAIGEITGVSDIRDDFSRGKRQFDFALTPAGYAAGLSEAMLARQLRQAFFGEEVQRVQRGRDEVRVYVRYPDAARASLSALEAFEVRLPGGDKAPLATVAEVTRGRAPSAINRSFGRRVITVSAEVDESVTTPNTVNAQILGTVLPDLLQRFAGLSWRQAGAIREQNRDLASLFKGAGLALLVIFALIAAQLRSYVLPIAIVASVPFGLSGAILGHFVLGYALGITSLFGMIALAGVAVNASVVLVDYYVKLRARGEAARSAAIAASMRRFRPIILTTLTTALGMAPLLLESSPQAQFLIPMAISLGFGILVSGLMVLLVTPAIVVIIDDLTSLAGGISRRARSARSMTGA